MRYWQHNETGRIVAVDVKMAPSNWTELTKEQYEQATNERRENAFPNSKDNNSAHS